MLFWYDENNSPVGFVYTDKTAETPTSQTFFYGKNAFGDIRYICDETGKWIASYWYNEWGQWVDAVWDTSEELYQFLLNNNPLLYRGYYYDTETGYYYLQSRYYNPTWCRFINADDVNYIGASGNRLGVNAYLYCENNPINAVDIVGHFAISTCVLIGVAAVLGVTAITYTAMCNAHYKDNSSKKFNGYIYNQEKGNAAKMKFGFYKSSFNGCSWVATYNATIMLGKKANPCDIIKEYEYTGAILGGTLGVKPSAIKNFFKDRGYKVTTTYDVSEFDKVAKKNTANIIYYAHKKGTHFVALKWNGKKFLGYNTYENSKNTDNWGKSISSKVKERGWVGIQLISIKK